MHTLHIIDSEQFAEATAEAQEAANAALLERAREMAMAGDSSVMTTWMKALIPALRPQSSVAVGVQVNNGATSRHANLSGAQLRAEVERALEEDRRQRRYLETLRATGSAPRARQAAGVVRKTVSLWERDEQFAEAAAEAVEFARDALIQRARDLAMDGSEAMLGLFVRAYTPELRPAGTRVAVGVQVNNGGWLARMTDEERVAKLNQILRDAQMRRDAALQYEAAQEAAGNVEDAVVVSQAPSALGEPMQPPEAPDEPDVEDLL